MSATTRHGHERREFLVTAFSKKPAGRNTPSKDIIWSEVWHAHRPLPVGYPFRFVLQASAEAVRIRDLGEEGAETVSHPIEEIPLGELEGRGIIELGDGKAWVLIQPVRELREGGWVPPLIKAPAADETAAKEFFKRASIAVAGSMLLMALLIFLIPKPDPKKEELIPEQFAKVLLSPALKNTGSSQKGGGPASAGSNNVVQAFKSEAIQKTTKSLFSSKAANALLSGSSLLNTAASSAAARKIFDAKSALANGPSGAKLEVGSKDVGMVGGRNAKGYAGGPANVEGQGSGTVSVGGADVGVSEGLTKDEVGKVIRDHMADVRYCYEAGLIRNPGLEGKLLMAFTVAPTGGVSKANVKESTGDNVVDQCIVQKLLKWKFPKPRGGVGVDITYPFIFKVLGG